MNKKAFTLVELIAVISLIAIIMAVAFPNFSKLTSTAKKGYDNTTNVLLESAASMYVSNNTSEVEKELSSNDEYCLPIGRLVAYEYVDSDLKTSKGEELDLSKCIIVKKETKDGKTKYTYEVSNETSSDDYLPPVISLKKKSTTECKRIMNITYNEFKQTCSVISTDESFSGANHEKEITNNPINLIKKNNKLYVEYVDTDISGNKSVSLTIELKSE